uniref:Uncharacterized protein n=1 Tax=Mesocestoides corti TaxID=53468 RepID=A0A5K3FMV6_MESCO
MTAAIRAITGGSTRQLDHLSTIQLVVFAAVVLTFVAVVSLHRRCMHTPLPTSAVKSSSHPAPSFLSQLPLPALAPYCPSPDSS